MAQAFVAISTVADGSMYDPSDQGKDEVILSRSEWLKKHGLSPKDAVRVHISYEGEDFCRYRIVDSANKGEGMSSPSMEYNDALVTTDPGVALFLPVADCVATTFFDEAKGVLMLSHLGRHSLEQDGGARSVQFLIDNFGVDLAGLKVWLSPAPGKDAYPIFKLDGKGMKEAIHEQLARAGVLVENITDNTADTTIDNDYFSHTAFLKGNKPTDGRFAMLAMMNKA